MNFITTVEIVGLCLGASSLFLIGYVSISSRTQLRKLRKLS